MRKKVVYDVPFIIGVMYPRATVWGKLALQTLSAQYIQQSLTNRKFQTFPDLESKVAWKSQVDERWKTMQCCSNVYNSFGSAYNIVNQNVAVESPIFLRLSKQSNSVFPVARWFNINTNIDIDININIIWLYRSAGSTPDQLSVPGCLAYTIWQWDSARFHNHQQHWRNSASVRRWLSSADNCLALMCYSFVQSLRVCWQVELRLKLMSTEVNANVCCSIDLV